ncbi:enoyl-CoA hydratase-related protein [Streptomyces sp. NPDC005811]|uniref:enoyl-CoA hydratase/isomerase family protein n=1 Tax=Streptomyces sp. NPDC005811 TaxID=3154565 RepID=UPI0033D6EBE2
MRVVTLNRPESLNAMVPRLHRALERVWAHLAADTEARAVVLTGAGRAFSAGGDLEAVARWWDDTEARQHEIDGARRLLAEIVDFPLPVVAAVNGPAVGLGCSLAVGSDIVLMAESAFLADPHVGLGLTAADGGTLFWPYLVGMLRAKEYLLTGDRIPAEQAVAIGLANRVVPDDELVDAALRLAERLAAQPPQAVRSTKQALNLHVRRAFADVLEYALAEEYRSFDAPEHRAVVEELREKARRRSGSGSGRG